MSKSRRRTPIIGMTMAESDKDGKRMANRRLRRQVRVALQEDREPALLREVSDVWTFPKDGKQWIDDPKLMRK
jgi:hypothetical protein